MTVCYFPKGLRANVCKPMVPNVIYESSVKKKRTLYRLLRTFLTQILQEKEFSWKNFRLRNILYSCTCSSSLINESSMLQHWKSCSTIKHDKRHFTIKLLRDMSVVGILFRFIKNSANQLYSVKVDFHCCVILTFLRFYILLYFTWTHVKTTWQWKFTPTLIIIPDLFVRPKLSVLKFKVSRNEST